MTSRLQLIMFEITENIEMAGNFEIPIENLPDKIRMHLNNNEYKEAFLTCRFAIKNTDFHKKFQ